MAEPVHERLTRRDLQKYALVLPAPLLALVLQHQSAGLAIAQEATAVLAPTPACLDDDDIEETVAQTEGPYFTPDSPERSSLLEAGIEGARLRVTGFVYSSGCDPVPNALLDFWHCDANGIYDNEGYRLRGHQFADDDGRFSLETILPGIYTGRTRHIHVKVQAPNQDVLTTQLYFPDEPENERDGIFDPSLLLDIEERDGEKTGYFTFVVNAG